MNYIDHYKNVAPQQDCRWKVMIEARKRGAIGEFALDEVKVTAPNAYRAMELAMAVEHRNGMETRAGRYPEKVEA